MVELAAFNRRVVGPIPTTPTTRVQSHPRWVRCRAMDRDEAGRLLDAEKARLGETKAVFEAEHLQDESEEESLSELSSVDQHQADIGTETFEREKDLSILEQVEAELDDVEHALQRLEEGTYGTCEACGKPIEEERLRAMPAARFCVEDQAKAEQEARAPGPR